MRLIRRSKELEIVRTLAEQSAVLQLATGTGEQLHALVKRQAATIQQQADTIAQQAVRIAQLEVRVEALVYQYAEADSRDSIGR